VVAALGRIAATGVAVIVVDQHAELALDWCHRALVMEAGRIRFDAAPTAETRPRYHEMLMLR
jgi:ABC-type branched-subunit amino acid transport system ATPase component